MINKTRIVPIILSNIIIGSVVNGGIMLKYDKIIENGIAKRTVDARTACVTLAFPIPKARM